LTRIESCGVRPELTLSTPKNGESACKHRTIISASKSIDKLVAQTEQSGHPLKKVKENMIKVMKFAAAGGDDD
jgi:hypothetical protein